MLKFFSIFFFSILSIYLYNQYLEQPDFNSHKGEINIQIHADIDNPIVVSDFYPFYNRINKCKRSVDSEEAVAQSYQKQTLFCDAVLPKYDYLTGSTDEILHSLLMHVYGNFNGRIMKVPIMS